MLLKGALPTKFLKRPSSSEPFTSSHSFSHGSQTIFIVFEKDNTIRSLCIVLKPVTMSANSGQPWRLIVRERHFDVLLWECYLTSSLWPHSALRCCSYRYYMYQSTHNQDPFFVSEFERSSPQFWHIQCAQQSFLAPQTYLRRVSHRRPKYATESRISECGQVGQSPIR